MLKNYFKIAWRSLAKNKTFSFINIAGLAIALAACIIIFLYVQNELTFDQYNTHANRIARVTTSIIAPESSLILATTPAPLGDALKREYPEIESTVRLEAAPHTLKLNNELFREDAFYKADQSVFSIFDFDFIEGAAKGALQNPHTIVITQAIAKKYFGNKPALGKTMVCNEEVLQVTGVVKDRPSNSDMHVDALLSNEFSKVTSWTDDFSVYTFILFNKMPDLKKFEHKLDALSARYVQPEFNAQEASRYSAHFELEPLAAVHFSQGKLEDTPKGNKQFSYIFSLLAVFILIIALLNYINLSTAKSTERAREVGIRKVSGAGQFQLIRQFLFESFLLLAIAWIMAIVLAQVALPFFNKLLQSKLSINFWQNLPLTAAVFLGTLLLAGLYPAFIMSGFSPIMVLKGSWRHNVKGVFLRKSVTVTQFAIAAALILGTTVIYTQMNFIRQKDLGFNKSQLLNIYLPRDSASQNSVTSFQNELRRQPAIDGFTVGNGMTQDGLSLANTFAEQEGAKHEFLCNYYFIDPQFLSVFQIQLREGRNLSESFATDKTAGFLVNEALVKKMGWKSGIGKSIEGFGRKGKVVGVVKNFYYRSMHNLIEPLILIYNTFPANTTTVKIKAADLPIVKALFKKNFPATTFDYAFFDDIVDKQYRQDDITMSLFKDFTILAIFISCMGLYGLVAFIAVQRTKEIGIRKVLGASVKQLLSLLTKDFLKLVLWALIIALPLAGIVMNKWLANYAYHAPLSWWMFLIAVSCVFLITLIVISTEVIKAAIANPVKSLRTE